MKMRVFVTGASGYLGAAIASRLAKSGCEVIGLVHRKERVAAVRALGVQAVIGDLEVAESYLSALRNSDAVVHTAKQPGPKSSRIDQLTLEAIKASVVDGRVRHVLYTSGVWVHGNTGERPADETSELDPAETVAWRPAHEEAALDLLEHEAHVTVLRPGVAYGRAGGILGEWFRQARDQHGIHYPGDGSQHWAMVHVADVAEGYRLALEHARGGQRFLLADESHFTVRELAEAAARAAGVEAHPVDRAQWLEREGVPGAAKLLDQRVTAARARRELGWVPRHTSFVQEADDLYRDWLAGQEEGSSLPHAGPMS